MNYKVFLIKSGLVSFVFIGLRIRKIEDWSDIETVKLLEIILGTALLEKILSSIVSELLINLLGCSICGKK